MNDIAKSNKWDFLSRPNSPVLDKQLGIPKPCLDHGFIRIIDYMGDQAAIVQAARVSYGEGTQTKRNDRNLIRYLLRHWHTTPFEMCELKLHCKMPIFVARQWIRHRTASINEYSGRYSIMPNEFYVPRGVDIQPQSLNNKQGRDGVFSEVVQAAFRQTIKQHAEMSFDLYEELWTGWPMFDHYGQEWPMEEVAEGQVSIEPHKQEHGMSRELARTVLPLNAYTEFYWKIDLHNLLHFLRLRADGHAQTEIRVFAEAIADVVAQWLPDVWEAFVDYQRDAVTFSKQEQNVLAAMFTYCVEDLDNIVANFGAGMSDREKRDFVQTIREMRA